MRGVADVAGCADGCAQRIDEFANEQGLIAPDDDTTTIEVCVVNELDGRPLIVDDHHAQRSLRKLSEDAGIGQGPHPHPATSEGRDSARCPTTSHQSENPVDVRTRLRGKARHERAAVRARVGLNEHHEPIETRRRTIIEVEPRRIRLAHHLLIAKDGPRCSDPPRKSTIVHEHVVTPSDDREQIRRQGPQACPEPEHGILVHWPSNGSRHLGE